MESDTAIRHNVIEELDFEPSIDPKGIGVAVHNGVVTLTGHVPSFAQKLAATHAAQRIRGVEAVACELTVRLPNQKKRRDDEIAERALSILSWTMDDSSGIKVTVENGFVTLSGVVDWQFQKQDAETAVRRLGGVVNVANNVVVRPRLEQSKIERRIHDAFARNAVLESSKIHVEVQGGAVTLSGKVKAWYERRMAEDAAWAIPGVTEVYDNIVVQ